MNGLLKLEVKILAIYRRLALLEIDGQKGTTKYNNILEDLRKKLKKEEELLHNLDLLSINPQKLEGALNVAGEIDESIQTRIMMLAATPAMNELLKNTENEEAGIYDKIREETQANISLFTIKLVKDKSMDVNYEKYRAQLISSFYEMCYLHPAISIRLIDNAFEIGNNFVKSSYLVGDVNNVDRKTTKQIVDEYCTELLLPTIGRLFHNERYTSSDQKELHLLLFSCTVKAIEMMLSDLGLEKAKYAVLKKIEDENLASHPNYEYLINLLFDPNRPREEVPTVTFGKPLK